MIALHDRDGCTGCAACAMICPVQCIRMIPDREGFLYPSIDESACIHCGRCEKVCPVSPGDEVTGEKEEPFRQTAYVLQHRSESIRRESTSGGAFSAIAEWVIRKKGVVFGAAYNEDFSVSHARAETAEDLKRFRNSKYVQSDVGQTFREVRDLLSQGRWVCYSGTPCQIEGLMAYIGRREEKLVTVDLVCHAVPSPLVWKKYLEMQEETLGEFRRVLFRDKHYGYKYPAMSFFDSGGRKLYARGIDTDQMTRAFFSDICDRPSCYRCPFKKRYRVSDFTIWDCYDAFLYDRKMDDDRGTSSVLIHTDKGRRIFSQIRGRVRCTPVDPDRLTSAVREMFRSVKPDPRRGAFLQDAADLSGRELFDKYFPETAKVRGARLLRVSLCRLGLYAPAKRMLARIRRLRARQ